MLEPSPRPLDLLSTVILSVQDLERLRAIEEYDLWFVSERVVRKGVLAPHLAEQAITEFKRYMALIALGYTNLGMLSQEVDEVWHNFILFTREYGEFCEATCGQMVHHRPNTSLRPQLPPSTAANFKEAYTRCFGPLAAIWRQQNARHPVGNEQLPWNDCDVAGGDEPVVLHAGECDVSNQGECDSGSSQGGCDSGDGDDLGSECDAQAALGRRVSEGM